MLYVYYVRIRDPVTRGNIETSFLLLFSGITVKYHAKDRMLAWPDVIHDVV